MSMHGYVVPFENCLNYFIFNWFRLLQASKCICEFTVIHINPQHTYVHTRHSKPVLPSASGSSCLKIIKMSIRAVPFFCLFTLSGSMSLSSSFWDSSGISTQFCVLSLLTPSIAPGAFVVTSAFLVVPLVLGSLLAMAKLCFLLFCVDAKFYGITIGINCPPPSKPWGLGMEVLLEEAASSVLVSSPTPFPTHP
jgi:hypothetical protein